MSSPARRPAVPGGRLGVALLLLVASGVPAEVVLRVGSLTELEPLSPMATSGFWYGSAYTGLVHQPLVTTGSDGRLAPCLARRWEVSADNRAITFHLEPGARWHDGTPLTGADVAFTLDFIRQHQLIGQLWRFYEGSQVHDDSTVTVHFREDVAYYQSLMFAVPPVLPQHLWAAIEQPRRFAGHAAMIGSGVFAFHAWDVDARVAYLRRAAPAPGRPAPPIDRVEIRFFSSPGALFLALRRGEVDLLMGAEHHVPPAFVDAVAGAEGVGLLEQPAAGVPLSLVFHGGRWPTQVHAFRRAVAHAVDSDAFARTVLRGRGTTPDRGFLPPGAWTHDGVTELPAVAADVPRARALLDSLGFVDVDDDGLRKAPDGTAFVLPLIPETWQSAGKAVRATELLVSQLRAVGLAARVDKHVVDREYTLLWDERDYLAYVGHTTLTATRDGGHVYFADYTDFSYGTFADSSYLALIDGITHARDEAAYLAAVADARAWNAAQLPGLALAWGTQTYAWRDDRFDDWSPAAGLGLPTWGSWSSVRAATTSTPIPAGADVDPTSGGGAGPWLLAAAVIAAAVAGWRLRSRR